MTQAKTEPTAPTGLALLRAPFPPNQISKLPKPFKKDSPKGKCKPRSQGGDAPDHQDHFCGGYHGLPAAHLDYVGHAAATDRMLDADPSWGWEPFAKTEAGLPLFDQSGGLWINLTICGVTRPGYGHAAAKSFGDPGMREKEVIGDALRNAGMRFGMALDLWHKGDLHLDEEGNGDSPALPEQAFVDDDTVTKIISLCGAVGGGQTQVICKAYKVDAIPELTPKQAQSVVARLNEKLAQKAKSEPNAIADELGDEIPY